MDRVRIKDRKLAEWLRSNPANEVYSKDVPVMGLELDDGFLRWPLVQDQKSR